MNFIIFLISLQLDSDIHINLYYLFQIFLMSNSANIMLRNPSSLPLIPQRDMDPNVSHISNYFDQQVPILSISKNLGKISLVQKEDGKSKKTSNDNYLQDTVAFGTLYGIDEVGISVRYEGIFQANFLGMMQIQPIQELDEHTVSNIYFQGKISNIQNKIALITPQTSQNMHNQQYQPSQIYLLRSSKDRMKVDQQLKYPEESCFQNLKTFRGFFNGSFHNIPKINELNLQDFKKCQEIVDRISKDKGINLSQSFFNQDNKKNKPKKQAKSYYVPALVTFQLGKLIQINRQKSSVDISASLNIIIRLNQDIVDRIQNDQQQYQNQQHSKLTYKQRQKIKKQDIKKLYEFTIQFHRGRVITLPFYNIDQQPQQLIQDEWAEPLQGIDVVSQWDEQLMIMKYKITTIFRAQIDNGFGIFYSPFNLNVMKIVITLHSLKIGNTSIHINCCDLSDSQHGNDYKPYTFFSDLQVNKQAQKDNMVQQMFAKHIERRSKINIDNFIDEGEYKLADNRMTLFPYHKRKFDNQVNRANKYSWMFGVAQRSSLLEYPIIKGLKQRYQQAIATKKIHYSKFQIPEWMFVHVQIPIFRYPVIDLIRIFVPILILSTISLLIFVQENATDGNGFTTLAKRIASGCSLMIAYVALVPMIRSNLPPTPSVTLIQILIYVSTIPNFLAIISNLITDFIDFNDFFTNYTPFSDGLFLVSFLISVVSFIILLILAVVFSRKMYKSPFILNKTKPLSTDRARNPIFMKMVEDISKNIKEYRISFCK